jgi:acyl-CoA synthetase (AMP-forming)/AMP-acid ligase II
MDPNKKVNFNIAMRLAEHAQKSPQAIAIATPRKIWLSSQKKYDRQRPYTSITFEELNKNVDAVAAGLQNMGMQTGDRIVLLVHFGVDFITLVLAMLKAGITTVLIDPGMPREHLIESLAAVEPDGFIAIPKVQLLLKFFKSRFPNSKKNVTVGSTFGILPKITLRQLLRSDRSRLKTFEADRKDAAAIIFTTGSTGPPKGVEYTHEMFCAQVDQLIERFNIKPGGVDLACFPLFGLFDAVMGTTTVIPDMNPIRPADAEPVLLLNAIDQWKINQVFGSPALWKSVGRYCDTHARQCPSLKLVLSAGAPVPSSTLMSIRQMMHADGFMYTPYGATEALPIASIESREVLEETASLTEEGMGTCVGTRFSGIDWKVIAISDLPIHTMTEVTELANQEIGELIVHGPVVSERYVTRTDQNEFHKIHADGAIWHRTGDVGYFDLQGRFFYCGRKSHRVVLKDGVVLFTDPCESILNRHPQVNRTALVGVEIDGEMKAIIVVEPTDLQLHKSKKGTQQLIKDLKRIAASNDKTTRIDDYLIYPERLPTDIRHNSKIFREKLQLWAAEMLND